MVGEGEAAEFVRKGIPAGTEKTTSPKEKMLEESFRENKTSVSYFNTKMGMERKPMNKPFRSRTAPTAAVPAGAVPMVIEAFIG